MGQFGFAMHPFFFALFCRQLRVLIAPLGGVGKPLSPAHPYWGVPHLKINRPRWPFYGLLVSDSVAC